MGYCSFPLCSMWNYRPIYLFSIELKGVCKYILFFANQFANISMLSFFLQTSQRTSSQKTTESLTVCKRPLFFHIFFCWNHVLTGITYSETKSSSSLGTCPLAIWPNRTVARSLRFPRATLFLLAPLSHRGHRHSRLATDRRNHGPVE